MDRFPTAMGPDTPFSSLLQDAWLDNLSTLHQLQHRARLTDHQAAELCGVSLRTWRRWKKKETAQSAALRMMAILAGHVPWAGWDGWEMHNGYLFPPGYSRHGFSPGDIFALHFERQSISQLKYQLEEIKEANRARRKQAQAFRLRRPVSNFTH